MFTGLVQSLAKLEILAPEPGGVRLVVREPEMAARSALGASIALNGCCLTVVDLGEGSIAFQAGEETLSCTNLGQLKSGDRVNLEASMKMGDEIGGHLVTGHIDAVGTVDERNEEADWATFWFRTPRNLVRQMANKASITVDGVSLTLVDVEEDRFSIALIPHTLAVTTLGFRQVGDTVNLETDLLAKYVEQQLKYRTDKT